MNYISKHEFLFLLNPHPLQSLCHALHNRFSHSVRPAVARKKRGGMAETESSRGSEASDGPAVDAPIPSANVSAASRRFQQTQAQVDEVVGIMRTNVEKVLERDTKLSELVSRLLTPRFVCRASQSAGTDASCVREKREWCSRPGHKYHQVTILLLMTHACCLLVHFPFRLFSCDPLVSWPWHIGSLSGDPSTRLHPPFRRFTSFPVHTSTTKIMSAISQIGSYITFNIFLFKCNIRSIGTTTTKNQDDRADALNQGASLFEQQAGKLKRKYWWQNLKVRIPLPSDPAIGWYRRFWDPRVHQKRGSGMMCVTS